jgi:hypothetical protein
MIKILIYSFSYAGLYKKKVLKTVTYKPDFDIDLTIKFIRLAF